MREALRNPVIVLKNLSEKSCDKNYRFQRLYRNLYNPEFYYLAYNNIYANKGSMTAGVDGTTIDDMSIGRIEQIIEALKNNSYQPNPARRTYIEKKGSTKKRPLGIPSANDKLVQEIVRMILESIYEPTFSNNSHGFRPNRSCHSALKSIDRTFLGAKWFIEGDIKACFDSFDHHVLIKILRRRIDDEYFIALMWKFLKAGYMEQWEYNTTYSGTPQGSGISPILANVYLTELDNFIEEYKCSFDKGDSHSSKRNSEYSKLRHQYTKMRKEYGNKWDSLDEEERMTAKSEVKKLRNSCQKLPYREQGNSNYKRIQYCRYCDDFIIGVIGSKKDAETIKEDIKLFLQNKLKLTMSEEKTKITHSTGMARFLGYDITISRSLAIKRTKSGYTQRLYNGKVKMYVPKEKWVEKLKEYDAFKVIKDENGKEIWKPMHRGKLINLRDIDIISKYNAEIRGIYNYYKLADNVSILNCFAYIMKYSMYKTYAGKYKTSTGKIIEKYTRNKEFAIEYETKAGKKKCIFYNGGFKKQKLSIICTDTLPQYQKYDRPNSIAGRLKGGKCEYCGITSDDIRMHHVKKLNELKGDKAWEQLMIQKRRKTLAVCPQCHEMIHDGII